MKMTKIFQSEKNQKRRKVLNDDAFAFARAKIGQ